MAFNRVGSLDNGLPLYHCVSTDTKDESGIIDGAVCIELNTPGKSYTYSEANLNGESHWWTL